MSKSLFVISVLFIISCKENSNKIEAESSDWLINKVKIEQAIFRNNLIYLDIPVSNDTLTFFTDTGGGRFVYPEVTSAEELKIDSSYEENKLTETVDLDELFLESKVPKPSSSYSIYRGEKYRNDFNAGMLGSFWFGNRIWEFNYEDKSLYSIDTIHWSKVNSSHPVQLGLQKDESGNFTTHFPRIEMIVQNDTIPVLFDTGATINPSYDALVYFNNKERVGGSFIITSIFEKWKSENPDWKVIDGGDTSIDADIIEVPEIIIGNHTVGPVWFAKRADQNFTEWMSKWMDKTIEGAIGGSCFKHFKSISIDYPNQKVLFLR